MSETDNIVVRPDGEGSVLRTDKLVKRYGKRTVANGVSINVRQGEIVGLLGPNGAGKTTSFYMTTGLVVPNELMTRRLRITLFISVHVLVSVIFHRRQVSSVR